MQKTCYYLDLSICHESKNSDVFFAKEIVLIKYFHKQTVLFVTKGGKNYEKITKMLKNKYDFPKNATTKVGFHNNIGYELLLHYATYWREKTV